MTRERFRLPVSRRQMTRDLADEMDLHLSLCVDALMREGSSREAAVAEAERRFGDTARVREECLEVDAANHFTWSRRTAFEELRQDTQMAWRSLSRDRSFATVAILIVALGIGASTAIFSLYNGVVLRALPVADAHRTMWVTVGDREGSEGVSPALAFTWRESARSFEHLATMRGAAVTMVGAGDPARLDALRVGPGFGETMGLAPSMGRTFLPTDFAEGQAPVVLIAHSLWLDRFGGDPTAVGRSVNLDGVLHTIVGVFSPDAEGRIGTPQVVFPDALPNDLRENFTPFLEVVARLRPSASATSAQAELQGLAEAKALSAGMALEGSQVRVKPMSDHLSEAFRGRVVLLLGAVLCVLLIGCVNVANLLLARSAGRARELAVRAALGASRGRLVRQLLTENFLLVIAGGLGGTVVAVWLIQGLRVLLPQDLPRLSTVALDGTSLLFATVLTAGTALLAGLLPAWRAARANIGRRLQEGGRSSSSVSSDRLRRTFVALEVALSAVLLVVAGLLLRSAQAMGGVAPGFAVDSVLTVRYSLSGQAYATAPQVVAAHGRILSALQETERDRVALTSSIPLGEGSGGSDFYALGGSSSTPREVNASLRFVSPGYLRTMGITLLEGRDMDQQDGANAPRRLLISETLARRLGIAGSPIGLRLAGTSSPFKDSAGTPYPWEIVGMVREPRDAGLRSDLQPQVFIPLAQTPAEVFDWSARAVHVVLRGGGAREVTLPRIAAAVHSVDPDLALFEARTMAERLHGSVAFERANSTLVGALGIAAVVLAISGLYGVVSYSVRQREQEFGVRMALGASSSSIVRMVVRWGAAVTLMGLCIGVPAALAIGRAIRGLLFGVQSYDAATFALATALLIGAAVLGCVLPAARAGRVPPTAALKS